mmetsp:Transcript_28801/g.44268  ORF Transcript_28801/g.44268 Transcript_28801/m.44268 type:complete len:257 (+) Transcript_28801:281-1051(+)
MPCQESIADAKAIFVSAVSEGIDVLMSRCGFSRERATSALIRELNRGETTRPSDEEVFQIVKNNGLGIEEATKTLIISRALKRAMSTSGSPAKAIELLASKISLSNLLYESDEDPSSDEDILRPEQSIARVSSVEKFSSRTAIKTPVGRKTRGSAKKGRPKAKSATKAPTAGRKRTIDEILPAAKKSPVSYQPRQRSDSAADEVDAKLAKQSIEEGVAIDPMRSAPSVRAKRVHRSEDADPLNQPGSLKRSRGTES